MTIRTRLVAGLFVLLTLMVAQATLGIRYANQLTSISSEIGVRTMERVEYVGHLSTALIEYRGSELGNILGVSHQSINVDRETLNRLWQEVEDSLRRYQGVIDDPEREAKYEAVLHRTESYAAMSRETLSRAEAGEAEKARLRFASSEAQFEELIGSVHQLRHEEFQDAFELAGQARRSATRSRIGIEVITMLVLVLASGLGWYVWRYLSRGLNRFIAATRQVSEGDLSQPVPIVSKDEFGELARSFNSMLLDLKQSQDENLRLTNETLRMREEHVHLLRDSLGRVVKAQEEERKRVARELHDQTGQALMALHLGLTRLERASSVPSVKQQAASLSSLAVETAEGIRNLALDLRPAALDELGLVPALQNHVRDLSNRVGIPIDLKASGMDGRLSPETELVLFRTVQEALTNLAKHSQASHGEVTLTAHTTRIEARVEDNGIGFNVSEVLGSRRRSLGLFGIQERVELLGGSLQIESEPRKGTSIVVSVPLE